MPFEGVPGPLDLNFYDPVPNEAVANDDLDLQLLWLASLERKQAPLDHADLCDAWRRYQVFAADEYGIARWNLFRGIEPPLSGVHNNWFRDGMGAAIRSEIWACLFPGQPQWAAWFAWQDACVDHAGDGIWAEVFLAATQSLAFVNQNVVEVIRRSLGMLPEDCRLRTAIEMLLDMFKDGQDLETARRAIFDRFGSHNFTDCVMNLSFIVLGLLWGDGDFDRTVLTAVNCGEDTDCTGATVGATFGLFYGLDAIPQRWKEPVGEAIVVSDHLKHLPMPADLGELTRRTEAISSLLTVQLRDQSSPTIPRGEPRDTIDDDNRWLIFSGSQPTFSMDAPEPIGPDRACELTGSFPGIVMDLSEHLAAGETVLNLQTFIHSPRNVEGLLMICANAGITAWLDGRMVLNYHGRRPIVPAFHRTEGGGAIPVHLEQGRSHLLQIRLLGCGSSPMAVVAVGEVNCHYIPDAKFAPLASD